MKKLYLLTIELENGNVLRKIYRKENREEVQKDLDRLIKRHKDHISGFWYKELKKRNKLKS